MPSFPTAIAGSADLLALGLGLASGFSHCIGMCGIFVVSYAGAPNKDAQGKGLKTPTWRHLLFHGGRLATLAGLGVAGGAVGALGVGAGVGQPRRRRRHARAGARAGRVRAAFPPA